MLSINNKLEQILLNRGIDAQDIDKARVYQKKHGGALEQLLVNLGVQAEEELAEIYSLLLNVELLNVTPRIEDDFYTFLNSAFENKINFDFLISRAWVPYKVEKNKIYFVTNQPLHWEVQQYLSTINSPYQFVVANENIVEELTAMLSAKNSLELNDDDLSTLSELEEDKLRELASEAPTVNLLNSLIAKGLKIGASDMHVEPIKGKSRIRYRVDGVLHEAENIPQRLQLPLISRLKILSGMDIAEKRRPQDGKIELKIANTELDIRVSSLPLNDGESMVMRFLRKDSVSYDMRSIGISEDIQSWLEEDLTSTAGVVLLTGPTGSGKTTTLYTFLNALNNENVKIITLEDPVEYQLEGINQVQVNSDIGFDFSAGLRSIVRQDPDIIMLGEIRDKETASIAMQSALTGHLVFSTVHTNDAPSAFTRLKDLGVEEFLLNAAIVSIVAQRLARKLCEHCAIEDENSLDLIKRYQLDKIKLSESITLKKAVGCESCGYSGYKGRTAIIEYLRCDDDIKALTKDHSFIQNAKALNKIKGRRTLLEDGLLKAINGITTIDEIIRVAG